MNLIYQAASLLKDGQLVALPTETVYGLAGDALNIEAVKSIFEVKGRPLIDPLIVHVHSLEMAEQLAYFDEKALKLAEQFWPGPLTLVLPRQAIVPDLVTAGLETVAIRMPRHPMFRAVLEVSGLALACPSANPFGYCSPTRAEHVAGTLGDEIPMILDGGPCEIGLESTILYLGDGSGARILRQGPILAEEIGKVLGFGVEVVGRAVVKKDEAQMSPGMLEKHYSPSTPVRLFAYGEAVLSLGEGAAIVFQKKPDLGLMEERYPGVAIFWLSESGELGEVAHNLFHLMQVLDKGGYVSIAIEKAPGDGLGFAINDRLSRAAAK